MLQKYWQSMKEVWRLSQRKGTDLAGLDINADYLKILKINTSAALPRVEQYAIKALPSGLIVKDEIKDQAQLSAILASTYKQSGITTTNMALCIPRSATITKTVTVNSQFTQHDIESRVWIEANRHFPNLVEDIYLDFSVMGPVKNDPSQIEVMLIATRKDKIKPYLDLTRQAGLHLALVDVNTSALGRAMSLTSEQSPEIRTMGLLNIDHSLMTLIVMHEGVVIYEQDQNYDGRHLVSAKPADTEVEEANMATDTITAVAGTETKEMLLLKNGLGPHLRHAMQYFYSRRYNMSIQRILLTGDCVNLPQISTFIQNEVQIETVLPNPFKNMLLAPDIHPEQLVKHAPQLMLCCGLALSRLKKVD